MSEPLQTCVSPLAACLPRTVASVFVPKQTTFHSGDCTESEVVGATHCGAFFGGVCVSLGENMPDFSSNLLTLAYPWERPDVIEGLLCLGTANWPGNAGGLCGRLLP